MKRIVSLIMTLVLTMCMVIPGSWTGGAEEASAAAKDEGTIDEIAEQFGDPSNDPFDYTRKDDKAKVKKLAADLPAKFDLRDVDGTSYVTPVKFQNPFGNCWGFAAIAAAETSILGDDETRGDFVADIRKTDDTSKVQLDLSEKQLTYFTRMPIDDPSNPQNGEGDSPITLNPDEDPIAAAYNVGGFATTATSMFSAGVGPVLESENPLFLYKGKKGMIQKDWVDGVFQNYEYSANDDWKLDESLRFSHSFELEESFAVPSPAKITESGFENLYEFNPAGVAAIKEQLYQKRGVQIGYHDDTFNPATQEHGEYISDKYAQYTYTPEGPRHAVCIVGWDDNYSRDNFISDHKPPQDMFPDGKHEGATDGGNGAWLVKNSWGSGEEEFPNKGEGIWGIPVTKEDGKTVGSGYFWLSYYDQSIGTPEAIDFGTADESAEDYTDTSDRYDFMPISNYLAARVDSKVSTANVFNAPVCEEIRKVSCETTYPGTEVTFEVYLLADEYESPTDGLLMDTVTKSFEYGGFHKVKLNKPFTVMRGQSYAIVVTQEVPEESGKSYVAGVKLGTGKAVVNKGESLIFADGSWLDLSDKSLQAKLTENTENKFAAETMDNFPIKGFGKELPDVKFEVNYSGFLQVPEPDETDDMAAYFKAWFTDTSGNTEPISIVPEWKILEGGDGIVDIADGRDPSRKTIRCRKLGCDYLVITAEGIGQVIHVIRVRPHSLYPSQIKTGKDYIDLTLIGGRQNGLSGIDVLYRVKGTKTWKKKAFGPDAEKFRITGLKAGKRYDVMVQTYAESAYGRLVTDGDKKTSGYVGLPNTLKASGKTVKVKYSQVKKASVKIDRKKTVSVSKAKGAVTYTKASVDKKKFAKKFTVNKKTGKLTIKKGLKKGTYKVKIKVSAAGKGLYAPAQKTVTVKVTVK